MFVEWLASVSLWNKGQAGSLLTIEDLRFLNSAFLFYNATHYLHWSSLHQQMGIGIQGMDSKESDTVATIMGTNNKVLCLCTKNFMTSIQHPLNCGKPNYLLANRSKISDFSFTILVNSRNQREDKLLEPGFQIHSFQDYFSLHVCYKLIVSIPPKFVCEGIWRWSLGEVLRSRGLCPHEWD